jgi:hypothetical protein
MFALPSQLPLQLALHFASQVAEGGVPWHFPLQLPEQVALHDASHSLWFADDEHLPLQSAEHVPSQLPWQSNEPGFALHDPVQLPVHDVLQSTLADALHCPLHCTSSLPAQAASNVSGVHCAVHPPCVSTLHCASARTSMLPHDSRPA